MLEGHIFVNCHIFDRFFTLTGLLIDCYYAPAGFTASALHRWWGRNACSLNLSNNDNSNVYAVCVFTAQQRKKEPKRAHSHRSIYCEIRTKYYNFKDAVEGILPYREALKNTSIRHELSLDLRAGFSLTEVNTSVFRLLSAWKQLQQVCWIPRSCIPTGYTEPDSESAGLAFISNSKAECRLIQYVLILLRTSSPSSWKKRCVYDCDIWVPN